MAEGIIPRMRAVPAIVLALLLALLLAAAVPAAPAPAPAKLRILASILPLEEFASGVAGDRGEVSLLLPPGAGVHTWQPRPGDIMKLASADLFISVGANLEPWLADVVAAVPKGKVRVLEVSKGLTLMPAPEESGEEAAQGHGHEGLDPHVWLDFGLDEKIVDGIASTLAELDPEGKALFQANAAALKAKLRTLDEEFRTGLAGCKGREFILAGHDAFGYLARRYGLVQRSLYGLSPDSQPKPRDVMAVVDEARRTGVKTVFTETSVPPGLAETLARETGARVLSLSAAHNLTREDIRRKLGFFDIMREDLKNLREGLGCK